MQHEHIKVHFSHDWMNAIWERKVPFFAVFLTVAFVTYGFLFAIDFYPENKSAMATSTDSVVIATTTVAAKPAVAAIHTVPKSASSTIPLKVIIEPLERTVAVSDPKSTDVTVLDTALLKGAIHYPGSATFEKPGTMVLLGHSSYLPVVHNKNYQAFNGIQKLVWGDIIRVQSSDTEYVYRVQRVVQAKASTSEVELQWVKSELILITCNSFGAKEDRFVVEAYLIDTKPLLSAPQNGLTGA
jgi:LPXTG-site transpeptidase (sortase) family protein